MTPKARRDDNNVWLEMKMWRQLKLCNRIEAHPWKSLFALTNACSLSYKNQTKKGIMYISAGQTQWSRSCTFSNYIILSCRLKMHGKTAFGIGSRKEILHICMCLYLNREHTYVYIINNKRVWLVEKVRAFCSISFDVISFSNIHTTDNTSFQQYNIQRRALTDNENEWTEGTETVFLQIKRKHTTTVQCIDFGNDL